MITFAKARWFAFGFLAGAVIMGIKALRMTKAMSEKYGVLYEDSHCTEDEIARGWDK